MTLNEVLNKVNEIRSELCSKHEVEIGRIEDVESLIMFCKEGLQHRAHHHKYNQKRNRAAAHVGIDRSMMRLSIDGNVKMISNKDRHEVEVGIVNKD
jgi:hypothetical protein